MLGMQLLQARAGNVGVNLRGRNIGMPQEQLHHPQVSAVVEQMRGNAWRRVCGDSGTLIPACSAYFFTSTQNMARDMALPRWVTKQSWLR